MLTLTVDLENPRLRGLEGFMGIERAKMIYGGHILALQTVNFQEQLKNLIVSRAVGLDPFGCDYVMVPGFGMGDDVNPVFRINRDNTIREFVYPMNDEITLGGEVIEDSHVKSSLPIGLGNRTPPCRNSRRWPVGPFSFLSELE